MWQRRAICFFSPFTDFVYIDIRKESPFLFYNFGGQGCTELSPFHQCPVVKSSIDHACAKCVTRTGWVDNDVGIDAWATLHFLPFIDHKAMVSVCHDKIRSELRNFFFRFIDERGEETRFVRIHDNPRTERDSLQDFLFAETEKLLSRVED